MAEAVAEATEAAPRAVGTRERTWKAFRRNRPAMAGLIILVALVLMAFAAPLLTAYDPVAQDLEQALERPSVAHPFGTDHLGRDIMSRILYGARISLFIGVMGVGLGLIVGVPLGLVSGYFGGWVDIIVQRIADVMLAFPAILLALSLVAVLGVGLQNVIIAVGISVVPIFMRLARGSVLSIREQTYVEAARALGGTDVRIIRSHVLPNSLAPLIVQATLSVGITILIAAGLGFLGLGVQPPTPEWGSMLGEGRQYIFNASYMATFPGLAIAISVLAFNLVGDGLRDALDPHMRTL
jgi:ABC-type dipeptide/oligopeptide/nickel transport system permease subunit